MMPSNPTQTAIVRVPPESAGATMMRSSADKLASLESYGGCKRFLPQLPGMTDLVIDFLSQGVDYEMMTVERAVYEGNLLFDKGEYLKALDLFGIAYEIFRFLPGIDRYFPLAHDCIIRRVVCWSIIGKFDKGLEEVLVAQTIVPNSPSAFFIQGILFSKNNQTIDANNSFQRCVAQNPDYHNFIDLLVGIFMHMGGYFDHAVAIATKVMQKEEQGSDVATLALLLRADSYKYHTSGYYVVKAADDYAVLLNRGERFQKYLGNGFSFKQHELIETMFVRQFTTILDEVKPRGFYEYPMFGRVRDLNIKPLAVVGFVFMFAGRLCSRSRATRLLHRMERQQQDLRIRREQVEAQLAAIEDPVSREKKKAVLNQVLDISAEGGKRKGDDGTIVWGPSDPDLCNVKPYRRFWMERPPRLPPSPKRKKKRTPRGGFKLKKKKESEAFTQLFAPGEGYSRNQTAAAQSQSQSQTGAGADSKDNNSKLSDEQKRLDKEEEDFEADFLRAYEEQAAIEREKQEQKEAQGSSETVKAQGQKDNVDNHINESGNQTAMPALTEGQHNQMPLSSPTDSYSSSGSMLLDNNNFSDVIDSNSLIKKFNPYTSKYTIPKNNSKLISVDEDSKLNSRGQKSLNKTRVSFGGTEYLYAMDRRYDQEISVSNYQKLNDSKIPDSVSDSESDDDDDDDLDVNQSYRSESRYHNVNSKNLIDKMLSDPVTLSTSSKHIDIDVEEDIDDRNLMSQYTNSMRQQVFKQNDCDENTITDQDLTLDDRMSSDLSEAEETNIKQDRLYVNKLKKVIQNSSNLNCTSSTKSSDPVSSCTNQDLLSSSHKGAAFSKKHAIFLEGQHEALPQAYDSECSDSEVIDSTQNFHSSDRFFEGSHQAQPSENNNDYINSGPGYGANNSTFFPSDATLDFRNNNTTKNQMSAEVASDSNKENHNMSNQTQIAKNNQNDRSHIISTAQAVVSMNNSGIKLPPKSIFQVDNLKVSMDNIIDCHKIPEHQVTIKDMKEQPNNEKAIVLALERPVACQPLPEQTGKDWTAEEWTERAIAAADHYISLEGSSPVIKRAEHVKSESINAHMMGRARYQGEDLISFVVREGLEGIEDFYYDLDIVEDVTHMEEFRSGPMPTVGRYNSNDPKSYIMTPGKRMG